MKLFRVIALIIFTLLFSKCKDNSADVASNNENSLKLNVKVDPRMELLSVIQHYTTWAKGHHTILEFTYKNEVNEYFKDYSEYPAVAKSEELDNAGFNYDAPAAFVLYHSDPPEFKQITPYSSYLIQRAGGESNLIDFANKIREFSTASHFMDFFNSHKEYYSELENEIKVTIGNFDYINLLEDYYGETRKSYNIVPTQLFHDGGYGPEIKTSGGNNIYDICGPSKLINNKPYFGNQNYLLYIVLHEFSHSFVNPITEKNITEINKYSKLMKPIKDKMQQMAYTNWITCVNEHLVRANTARFALKLRGKEMKDSYLDSEYNQGFIYIKKLDTLLEEYEKSRDVYKTYESFYPKIIEVFKSLM